MSLPKVSKKDVYESWRSFYSMGLKDDLCVLLLSQFEYLKKITIKYDLLDQNIKFENYQFDLGKICDALSK